MLDFHVNITLKPNRFVQLIFRRNLFTTSETATISTILHARMNTTRQEVQAQSQKEVW